MSFAETVMVDDSRQNQIGGPRLGMDHCASTPPISLFINNSTDFDSIDKYK